MSRHLVATALLFAAACGSTSPGSLTPCTGPVTMTATARPTPVISWTPACGVGVLYLETPPSLGAGYTRWWEITSSSMIVGPGVRYGDVPSGATETSPAMPLAPDREITAFALDSQGRPLGSVVVPLAQ